MANFPTALDNLVSLPNVGANAFTDSPPHDALHNTSSQAIIALETKLGIGSATPTLNLPLVGGSSGSSLYQVLGVLGGGTGATTAAGARSSLSAAQSGVNGDITSLTALSTPLSVSQGGTGVSTISKFQAYRSTAQTLAANGWSKIQGQTEVFDLGTNYDNTVNYRFTAPINGYYDFAGQVYADNSVDSTIYVCSFYRNGTEYFRGDQQTSHGTTLSIGAHAQDMKLNAGDYIELWFFNGHATNTLNVPLSSTASTVYTRFSGRITGVF